MKLKDYLGIANNASDQEIRKPAVVSPTKLPDKINGENNNPAQPVVSPSSQPATPAQPPQQPDYAKELQNKGYYGFFRDTYKSPNLEDEEKIARKQRNLALLGDIAKVAGQSFASTQGARQFTPLNSQVPAYNDRLQKLRDAKRAYDLDYQNKSLNAIYQDFRDKRAQEALDAKYSNYDAQRKFDKYKFETGEEGKNKRSEEQNKIKEKALNETKSYHNQSLQVAKANAAINKQRADAYVKQANEKSKSDKNYDYLPLGENLVPVPKAQTKGLYSKLYQIMKRDPQIQGSGVENIQLQFGEGGDQDTKMMNVVRRRLNDSPAAVQALQDYLGTPSVERTQSFSPTVNAPWASKSTNKAPWAK